MKVCAAVQSHVGYVRRGNEDNFFLNGSYMEKASMTQGGTFSCQSDAPCQVYAVCDGMGGERGGAEASWTAVSGMNELRDEAQTPPRDRIDAYVGEINQRILAYGAHGHMGTTLTMLHFDRETITVAHLGDSRIYLLRDDTLLRLTQDHSEINRLLSLGLITPEAAKTHPLRHGILRYLGMDYPGMKITPTYAEGFQPLDGDRFLLCSDGVTDMLSDDRIESLLCGGSPKDAAGQIVQAALEAGGVDNTTAMVVDVRITPLSGAQLGTKGCSLNRALTAPERKHAISPWAIMSGAVLACTIVLVLLLSPKCADSGRNSLPTATQQPDLQPTAETTETPQITATETPGTETAEPDSNWRTEEKERRTPIIPEMCSGSLFRKTDL